jgi:opacity protein-like surface antigen
VRSLALLLALCLAPAAFAADREEPIETPILVPSPIPVGFLIAWKPSIVTVRLDSGVGGRFGSDKFQPLRILGRYTTTLFEEKLLARAELEGGQFQTDTQGTALGTDGYDVTVRLLGGTATRITQRFTITASAGILTRYQRGRALSGAPSLGLLGVTSNLEFEYRIAPVLTFSVYLEGGLAPIPYGAQRDLGLLSDASEFRSRVQLSLDLTTNAAVDIGYDFTRWHLTFSESNVLAPGTSPDKALMVEAREHAITLGLRWKP